MILPLFRPGPSTPQALKNGQDGLGQAVASAQVGTVERSTAQCPSPSAASPCRYRIFASGLTEGQSYTLYYAGATGTAATEQLQPYVHALNDATVFSGASRSVLVHSHVVLLMTVAAFLLLRMLDH